ncbi:MAG TPA: PIN domain-containing protein [Candidatus Angelobacter sp.]|nr:PIN domain-containing protein [Candidatus Angelobacter sp.]
MILLDTHVLLWMSADPKRLSHKAHDAIRRARENTGIAIATITLWELALLAERRRIHISGSVESFVYETVSRVILKPITPQIAALAVRLPASIPKIPQTV